MLDDCTATTAATKRGLRLHGKRRWINATTTEYGFRIRGKYSSTGEYGTGRTVEDHCDGTLTRGTRGEVLVNDHGEKSSIYVQRGQTYFARAPSAQGDPALEIQATADLVSGTGF